MKRSNSYKPIIATVSFQQNRRLDLLTITHPKNMISTGKKVRVVVILSRIHPGETPASYVCQGKLYVWFTTSRNMDYGDCLIRHVCLRYLTISPFWLWLKVTLYVRLRVNFERSHSRSRNHHLSVNLDKLETTERFDVSLVAFTV